MKLMLKILPIHEWGLSLNCYKNLNYLADQDEIWVVTIIFLQPSAFPGLWIQSS